jgi:hypothetical protein
MNAHAAQSEYPPAHPGLVGETALREIIWTDPSSRPSRRWFLELKAKGLVPFHRIGRRVFFDPTEVRAALDHQFRVNARRRI